MTPDQLAMILFMVCGTGHADKAEDCRDKILNCSVGKNGEIKQSKVQQCIKEWEESQ